MSYGGILGQQQNINTFTKEETYSSETQAEYGALIDTPDKAFDVLSKAVLYNSGEPTPKYQEVTVNLSSASVGNVVRLPESGKLVEFYVANLNYESGLNGAGRVLLVRKDIHSFMSWNSSAVNSYNNSGIDTWLNNTYRSMLGSDVQSSIGNTQFYYTPGNGNNSVTTLQKSIFLLSGTELGKSDLSLRVEGTELPIADTLSIAYYNGNPDTQWTRSPQISGTDDAFYLQANGNLGAGMTRQVGARTCFTLPNSFQAMYYVDSNNTIHNSQEYIQSEETTDVQGNPINIGAKISTGSYVGNGAVGANYPNSLTFEFEPKVVFIAPEGNITNYCIPYVWGANYMVSFEGASLDAGHNHVSVSGNTMTWYVQQGRQTDDTQLNNMGTTYKYVAIG